MVLGLSSFTYGWAVGIEGARPDFPLDETGLLEKAVQWDMGCLQLGDNLPVHLFSDDRREAFRQALRDAGVRFELGAKGMTAANLERYIDLAGFFSAPLLRFVVDEEGYTPGMDQVSGILKDAAPELKKRGIILGIENHDRFKSRELAAILEAAGSGHIGICLDCANSMGAGEGLEHVTELLAPYTVNLHLKDFAAVRLPYKMGFTVSGAPFGQGLLDLDYLLDRLAAGGRCQSAVLEQWVPPEDSLEASIAKEESWAAEAVAYLRRLSYFD